MTTKQVNNVLVVAPPREKNIVLTVPPKFHLTTITHAKANACPVSDISSCHVILVIGNWHFTLCVLHL